MICSLALLVSESKLCAPGLQGECTVNLNFVTQGSFVLSEQQTRLGTAQAGWSKETLAGFLSHTRNSLVKRSSLMLSFQNKQEPLVSAWLILLPVTAWSELVAFQATFLRNLIQIPPSLGEIEGKIINSWSLHSEEASGQNAVKEIVT